MSRRSYTSAATPTTLAAPITSLDTTATIAAASNLPTSNFILTLDQGQLGEEQVLVGARTGTSLSGLTRGIAGTVAASHSAGASVLHTISALDADEANLHVNSTTGVHGLSGAVVGTTDAQTLTNKTLTSPTIGDFSLAQHTHSGSTSGGSVNVGSRLLVSDHLGSGGWDWSASSSGTGASYSLSTSRGKDTVLTAGASLNSTAYVYPGQETPDLQYFRGTYGQFQARCIPIYTAAAAAGTKFSFGVGSNTPASDRSANSDSAYIWIDVQTGAITIGGRTNATTATATPSSPPTIAASTAYDLRIEWPIAGGTANLYVNNTLIGTVAGLRSFATIRGPGFFPSFGITSGVNSATCVSSVLEYAVWDS